MILKENKKFGSKGNTYFNIFRKYCEKKKFLMGTLAKMSQKCYLHILLFQNILNIFFLYFEKKTCFNGGVWAWGVCSTLIKTIHFYLIDR